jgi:competence ComEA-like helix-hairpin-helix protein
MPATQRNWIKDYFTFTKKERRAVILLALFAIFFSMLPVLFPFLVKDETDYFIDENTEQQLVAMRSNDRHLSTNEDESKQTDWFAPKNKSFPQYNSSTKGELFYFDPNTAGENDFLRLGLRPKTIQTILNYRNKGGQFRKAEDISRIYGLSANEAERLMPYVKIEAASTSEKLPVTASLNKQEVKEPPSAFHEKKSKPIDINKADTAEWKSLKGIGSYYAKKIVSFRNKLGGFYSVQQVAETFGLPDSTFQSIQPFLLNNPSAIRQINVNTASIDELKAHPYLKATVANAIVNYRNNHGDFTTVQQLQNIGAIDDQLFQKIAPYLRVN